ncbi:hypothetical protein ACF05T_32850 [Streptomyces lateritius]|uniref:Uncharacterized protein n=1 Tax=Streptomyces lateritius TaxID=67313 RepID=A0ABW6YLZ1_9ACTN
MEHEQVITMQAVIRKRAAVTVCGFALCGALAAPAAIEVAATVANGGQVQTESVKGPKKPKKPKKVKAASIEIRPVVVNR